MSRHQGTKKPAPTRRQSLERFNKTMKTRRPRSADLSRDRIEEVSASHVTFALVCSAA